MKQTHFFAVVIVIFALLIVASIAIRYAPPTAAPPTTTTVLPPAVEEEATEIDRRLAEADENTLICEIWDSCEEFRVENREYDFIECMDYWEACVEEGDCDPIGYLLEAGKCENYTRYF